MATASEAEGPLRCRRCLGSDCHVIFMVCVPCDRASAIAANPAAPERANGSDGQQTSATRRQNRAERRTGTASARTGSAGQVFA